MPIILFAQPHIVVSRYNFWKTDSIQFGAVGGISKFWERIGSIPHSGRLCRKATQHVLRKVTKIGAKDAALWVIPPPRFFCLPLTVASPKWPNPLLNYPKNQNPANSPEKHYFGWIKGTMFDALWLSSKVGPNMLPKPIRYVSIK